MDPKRLPWSQKICYGVGHALNDLAASMWFSYLIVYLQLVLGFDSNYAGLILLIGQVADAVATPLLGYEVTNTRQNSICKRYGRRKFLHLIGTICVIVSFPFLFSICPGCERANERSLTLMLIPMVIIFQVGWAAVQVSHLSLIPVITPHEAERDFLNVFRYAVDIISDIGTYVIVWCVFDLTRKQTGRVQTISGEYADKFMLIVLIILGIGSFFSIVFHVGVKEVPSTPLSSEENSLEKHKLQQPLVDHIFAKPDDHNVSWSGWLKEKHFYQVGLLYMLVRVFNNMSGVFMPLYLQESLKANDDFIAKIPLVMNVSGFVMSCALPKMFKVLSKKLAFLVGAVMGMGSCVWVSVGQGTAFCSKGIYGVAVLMGGSASMLVISALSFTHDLIGTSIESGAFVYGCMSFWDKLANGIAGMIIQHLHSVMCKDCDWFYKHVISYFLGGVIIVSSVVLLTLLPTNLGQRKPKFSGVVLPTNQTNGAHKEQSVDIYNSIDDPSEEQPLLKNSPEVY